MKKRRIRFGAEKKVAVRWLSSSCVDTGTNLLRRKENGKREDAGSGQKSIARTTSMYDIAMLSQGEVSVFRAENQNTLLIPGTYIYCRLIPVFVVNRKTK